MKLLLFWNLYYFAGADLGGRGARAPFQNIMKFYQRQKKKKKKKKKIKKKKKKTVTRSYFNYICDVLESVSTFYILATK